MAVSGSDGRGKMHQCLVQMAEVNVAVSGSDGRGKCGSVWFRWQVHAVSGSDGRGTCSSVWFRWQRYMQCLVQMAEVHTAVSGSDGRGTCSSPHPPGVEPSTALAIV